MKISVVTMFSIYLCVCGLEFLDAKSSNRNSHNDNIPKLGRNI
jgi:hypothetical protein